MAEDNTGMVQRELSEAEVKQRADKLASEEVERSALLEKKRSHNREWNEKLKQHKVSIDQLAQEVKSGLAWVPAQESMFGDEDPVEPDPPARRGRGGRRRANEAGDAA